MRNDEVPDGTLKQARANDICERFGLARIINAAGPVTRLGASLMSEGVIAAMGAAARCSVDIGQLQGRASEVISRVTGAEAGIVTSGATAGLLLGAAACIAELDPLKMAKLPDSAGMRNEFIVSRSHRNSYDHGVRAAGARLVEVGLPDRIAGCGTRDTEAWEFESAIGDQTAGILYLARLDSRPDLASVVRVAHSVNIPVLVDAAAELPPAHNLRRYIEDGADLVTFSGGKALGGPSASGLLCGRRRLVGSALLQQLDLDGTFENWRPPSQLIDKKDFAGVPRNGIGRSCKVGKEQIIGLLAALNQFVEVDDDVHNRRLAAIVNALVVALTDLPGLGVRLADDGGHGGTPLVEVVIRAGAGEPNASQIASRLASASPAVQVDRTNADHNILMLSPTCLDAADAVEIRAAFAAALATGP